MAAKPIPSGFHTVTPYLTVQGANKLIDFLKQAFDAKEIERMPGPDGKVGHAQLQIGDSMVMMGEASGQMKPMNCMIYLYVNDADALYKRALQAGGTSTAEMTDQFYGDRSGAVKDPSGNVWWIATHKEDVPREEMKKRMEAHMQKQQVKQQHGA
jgi:PhnB protein